MRFDQSQKTAVFWSAMFSTIYIAQTGSTVFRPAMMNQDASHTTTRDQRAAMVCVN